jgi:hypothetical protein
MTNNSFQPVPPLQRSSPLHARSRLTGDNHRNLYTGGSGTPPCPIWQINLNNPRLTPVGSISPATGNCGFSGIAFNEIGDLFVADGGAGTIYTFKPDANTRPTATVFALRRSGSQRTCLRQERESLGSGTERQVREGFGKSPGPELTAVPLRQLTARRYFEFSLWPMR